MPFEYSDLKHGFDIADWRVIPERGLLQRGEEEVHLEPLVMDVLLVLAANQGKVVSKDQLVELIWARATADEVIAAKISALRRALGDDTKNPTYVETVKKRGYRLRASVPLRIAGEDERNSHPTSTGTFHKAYWLAGVALVGIAAYWLWPSSDAIETVAVTEFRNLSDDAGKYQYLVEGFSEELVVTLGQVPDLQIIRAGQQDVNSPVEQLAERLGADAIILGSLRTDGGALRVTAEMILADGSQVWANRFDADSTEIFSIQERVASEVRARVIGRTVSGFEASSRPANSEAFDAYLQGLYYLAKRDPDSLATGNEYFGQTIELDPSFGPAYLRQAISTLLLSRYSFGQSDEMYDRALDVAAHGAAADAGIRESAQLIDAYVNHQRGNWTEAANAYARAVAASTVYPTAHHWYSIFLGDVGLAEQALEQATIARSLEPDSPNLISRLAVASMSVDDPEAAQHLYDLANSMAIGVPDHYIAYAIFLVRQDRIEDAKDAWTTAMDLARQPSWWVGPLFDSLANPDDPVLRNTAIQIANAITARSEVPAYIPMAIWQALDDTEKVIEIAEREVDNKGTLKNIELIYHPEFLEFRQRAEFPEMLQRLGLTRYWSGIGCKWESDRLQCDE